MSTGLLHFICPACRAKLNVPASLAGVAGPCPRCGTQIQAPLQPLPASGPAPQTAAPSAPATPPVPAPIPADTPAPAAPPPAAAAPPLPSGVFQAPPQTPPPAETPRTNLPPKRTPQSIRPEPRNRPERPAPAAIQPRLNPGDTPAPTPRRRSRSTRHVAGRGRVARIAIPAAVAAASAAIVYTLLSLFSDDPPPPPDTSRGGDPAPAGAESHPVADTGTSPETPPASSPPDDASPASGDTANASLEAQRLLERFLTVDTLNARLRKITPRLPPAELRGGVLDGPLPAISSIRSLAPQRFPHDDLVSHPFVVTFEDPDRGAFDHTLVVHARPDRESKVAVLPFLDLFGGRLADFAAEPMPDPATFRAVIEPIPRCFEEDIPDPDKKFTYKLSAADGAREITRAYASKFSDLAEQLYERDSPIRWGIRVRATVTLRWNREENPDRPYLELTEIQSLDWRP